MTPADLLRLRPCLYHLTSRRNLPAIADRRELLSAGRLLEKVGQQAKIRTRRTDHHAIRLEDHEYVLRDQAPLQSGHLKLDEGATFEDFVELLNSLVFFWPGSERGPIPMGLNHFRRYEEEDPVVLRVGFEALLMANPGVVPSLATVNSGAPRSNPQSGKGRRGIATFIHLPEYQGNAGDVKEVVFPQRVGLPSQVELGTIRGGVWAPLE